MQHEDEGMSTVVIVLLAVGAGLAVLAVLAVSLGWFATKTFDVQKSKAQLSANRATISAIASGIATGQSTGGTVSLANGSLTIVDGTGASVDIPLSGATVTINNSPVPSTPLQLSGDTVFCASIPNEDPASTYAKMTETSTAPIQAAPKGC